MTLRLLLLCGCAVGAAGLGSVAELSLPQYLGRWYQVYSSASVNLFSSPYCVTADYALNPDGTVNILHQDRHESVTGTRRSVTGYVEIKDPSDPGRLMVSLDETALPSTYLVRALGPATYGGKYQWAVVSDPLKVNLFVLARHPALFDIDFEEEVLGLLKYLGFVWSWNKPLKTSQAGCVY